MVPIILTPCPYAPIRLWMAVNGAYHTNAMSLCPYQVVDGGKWSNETEQWFNQEQERQSITNFNNAPLFCRNGATSGFEMCFDIGSQHLGVLGPKHVSIRPRL